MGFSHLTTKEKHCMMMIKLTIIFICFLGAITANEEASALAGGCSTYVYLDNDRWEFFYQFLHEEGGWQIFLQANGRGPHPPVPGWHGLGGHCERQRRRHHRVHRGSSGCVY